MAEKTKSHLPSLQVLAKDSWELFKKTWVAYLKLVGLAIAYVFLALLIGLLLSLPITFGVIGSHFNIFSHLTPFDISALVLLILWFIFFFLSIIAIDVILPIVGIFILQGKKTSPIFALIKQAKPYFWPYFLTVFLTGLFVFGGIPLLLIPGLLIGFFFCFVAYEVVIDNQKYLTALKRSYFMVKNNFWEVLGRLIVLEVATIIVSSVLRRLSHGDGLLGLVNFLFAIFASWYARAYLYLLFKELRAKTTFPQQISITWIWVVSAIGWAIIILLLVGLASGLAHIPGWQPGHMSRVSPNAV
jgi:hypothetical protein